MKTKTRDNPARVLSVPEAGAELGLGKAASYAAVRRGAIPVIKLGPRRLVVSREQFDRLLAGKLATE